MYSPLLTSASAAWTAWVLRRDYRTIISRKFIRHQLTHSLTHGALGGTVDMALATRVIAFSVYIAITLWYVSNCCIDSHKPHAPVSSSLSFASIINPTSVVADIIVSTVPTAVFLIFGSQRVRHISSLVPLHPSDLAWRLCCTHGTASC